MQNLAIQEEQTDTTSQPQKLPMGLSRGISNADYHADREYVSSSVLKKIYKSLDDYYQEYILGNKKEIRNQGALDEGSLAHTLILEPHLFSKEYVRYNGWHKRGKEYDDFLKTLDPDDKRTVISDPQYNRVTRLVEVFKKHPVAPKFFENGEPELTLCVEINGVKIKTRFDYINEKEGIIVDIKTTGYSSDIDAFKATAETLDYPLSAALYLMAAEQYFGRPFEFYFCVLSKKDITCDLHKLGYNSRIKGTKKVYAAIEKLKKARETNVWTEVPDSKISKESLVCEIQEV